MRREWELKQLSRQEKLALAAEGRVPGGEN
jgi:predicted GIY-YIG superfamily endonuclease